MGSRRPCVSALQGANTSSSSGGAATIINSPTKPLSTVRSMPLNLKAIHGQMQTWERDIYRDRHGNEYVRMDQLLAFRFDPLLDPAAQRQATQKSMAYMQQRGVCTRAHLKGVPGGLHMLADRTAAMHLQDDACGHLKRVWMFANAIGATPGKSSAAQQVGGPCWHTRFGTPFAFAVATV